MYQLEGSSIGDSDVTHLPGCILDGSKLVTVMSLTCPAAHIGRGQSWWQWCHSPAQLAFWTGSKLVTVMSLTCQIVCFGWGQSWWQWCHSPAQLCVLDGVKVGDSDVIQEAVGLISVEQQGFKSGRSPLKEKSAYLRTGWIFCTKKRVGSKSHQAFRMRR